RDQRTASDAVQVVLCAGGAVEHAIADDEDVLRAAFTHHAAFRQENGFIVAVVFGFAARQRAVQVASSRLEARRDGVVLNTSPRGNANVDGVFVDVALQRQAVDDEG